MEKSRTNSQKKKQGSPKRKDAHGVGEWTSEGKDKCLWGPEKLEKKPAEEKKEGGNIYM